MGTTKLDALAYSKRFTNLTLITFPGCLTNQLQQSDAAYKDVAPRLCKLRLCDEFCPTSFDHPHPTLRDTSVYDTPADYHCSREQRTCKTLRRRALSPLAAEPALVSAAVLEFHLHTPWNCTDPHASHVDYLSEAIFQLSFNFFCY